MLYLINSGKISVMKRVMTEAAFKKMLFARVKLAREAAGYEAIDLANALGISKDQYLRYESRYVIRPDLVEPYCRLVGISVASLFKHPPKSKRQTLESI